MALGGRDTYASSSSVCWRGRHGRVGALHREKILMALRPSSFRAIDAAARDPRGGSLDPAVICDTNAGGVCVEETPVASNWVLGSNATVRRIAKAVERAAEVECTVLVLSLIHI